jgi:hypothetical protein
MHVGMLERPGDGLGNDFATRPDVAILQAVAGTGDCRFSHGLVRDECPLVGTVGAEV